MHLSILTWEASICSRWWLAQRPKQPNIQKIRDCRMLSPNGSVRSAPPPKSLRPLWKRRQEKCKCQRWRMTTGKQCHSRAKQGSCMYVLTAIAMACTKPVQAYARPNPSMEVCWPQSRSLLLEKWQILDAGMWEETVFSKSVAPGTSTTL